MENVSNIKNFFSEELKQLDCNQDTQAYIVSVLSKYRNAIDDYSKDSITLLYADATYTRNFVVFQNIGDWIFFCSSVFPEHLDYVSSDYYQSIARLSYNNCYKMMTSWKLFQEMADNFVPLSENTRHIIRRL